MKRTTYVLSVEGKTWGGNVGGYDYSINPEDADEMTLQKAKARAGDFEMLTSAQVIATTTETIVTVRNLK